ncbi:hypothetical protein X566_03800 [Afipia sp. P52-10]|jgi:uncharacterized protein YodC (DUF2158 family)|uniref:YodC family protein n=1 Tax=Afipia sp. P52-10 TaxID=1429916 RepID=UPI0003DEF919|nr:DUF2158 domain-containing protein [Afipia sp. P52-10]ETR76847.1 hypothetical protein X566_03800 [Afipia sp. P52-10]
MTLKAGDVVVLKSGGQPLTVAEVNDQSVACIWLGEEGDLFRETLPAIALELVEIEDDEDDDEDDEDEAEASANGHDDEEDEDADDANRAVA